VARAVGVKNVAVVDPIGDPEGFRSLLRAALDKPELSVIVSRRNCLLAAGKIKTYERANQEKCVEG
jgi:indolepyruvate ferredoxin oxidoreductase alpha subunit